MNILGLDFGTTNSCVSYYDGNKYNVIQNTYGKYITPSIIFFEKSSNNILYGDLAYEYINSNNGTCVSNIKRLLGVTWDDYIKDTNLRQSFKTINIEKSYNSDYCCVVLFHDNKVVRLEIHIIIQLYLKWLLKDIQDSIKDISDQIVITVPVEFNNNQRLLFKNILETIGYNVIRIVNEPTAATLAYINCVGNKNTTENVLVIDCGGGTTDFTILEADYQNMYFEVKDNVGDLFLGGEDITNLLVNYVLTKINCEISVKIIKMIQKQSEFCKKNLTTKTSNIIILENIGDRDYFINISRSVFENISRSFFERFSLLLQKISEGNIIENIVLVGGTTRIPKIKDIIYTNFDGSIKINNTLDPDHTISMGAAYQGYLLNPNIKIQNDITFLDTVSMSLGIKTIGDIMTPIISKNTIIPCSRTESFVSTDSNSVIDIEIYTGERRFVKDNLKLGVIHIDCKKNDTNGTNEMPNSNKDYHDIIDVTFDITSDGILIVTAREKKTNNEISVSFTEYSNSEKENLYTYRDETEKIEDMELSNKILAKIELQNTLERLKSSNQSIETIIINRTEIIILNYTNYTSDFLINYKRDLDKLFNELN